MEYKSYQPTDASDIEALFFRTFSDAAGETEGALIGQLVRDLMKETPARDQQGFVATDNSAIIGGIFFTRLSFDEPMEAFLLSPVAVHTNHQRRGVGQALIRYGLDRLKQTGVKLVVTYGDPDFYSKVGFEPISPEAIKAPYELSQPEGWLGQTLDGSDVTSIKGQARCVNAFQVPEIW